jgi:hypothetical protein
MTSWGSETFQLGVRARFTRSTCLPLTSQTQRGAKSRSAYQTFSASGMPGSSAPRLKPVTFSDP